MSLSETPPVKITYSTPQDISDEVLGGTLSFCKEIGYKQNIVMLTFLWSAFLLYSKSQLEEHNLIENTLNCYTHSLEKLFPKIREDVESKKQVMEILQRYWNNLNRDFEHIKDESEISALLQIAEKLNSQGDSSATYLLKKDPVKPFEHVAQAVDSSVNRILHQFDDPMGIQYRDSIQHPYYKQHTTPRAPTASPKKKNIPWKKVIIWGVVLIALVAIVISAAVDDEPTNPDASLIAVLEPRSGEVILGQEDFNGSRLTITASGGSSCVVKLKTPYGTTRLSFYVRAGDTVTVGVPAEHLYVYFASGEIWYGENHLFGSKTEYYKDDQLLDFTQYSWEYTLRPISNGNFSETPIDPEDF